MFNGICELFLNKLRKICLIVMDVVFTKLDMMRVVVIIMERVMQVEHRVRAYLGTVSMFVSRGLHLK